MNNHVIAEESKSFESILACQKDLIAVRAWRVTYESLTLCFVLMLGFGYVLLTHDKELVVIRVNENTGYAEVLTTVKHEELLATEAVGRFFAARYITLREQYIPSSIAADYYNVLLLSSNNASKDYVALYASADAPDRVYANNQNIKIEIISIAISDASKTSKLASVRFRKKIINTQNQREQEQIFAARLVYHFAPEMQMSDKDRLINPLGFVVESYQITPEFN